MNRIRTRRKRARVALTVAVICVAVALGIERPSGNVPIFGAWTELGPQAFYGFKPPSRLLARWELMSGQPAGMAVDLDHDSSGNTVYVCSASSGLWKSANGLGAEPLFELISNPRLTSSCGAVALDTSTNPPTIYVGTGDPDNPSNVSSYAGTGILISRDGGQTWTRVEGADGGAHPFQGMGFSRIIVDPDNPEVLLAATGVGSDGNYAHSAYPQANPAFSHLGIYRSADAGVTWSRVKSASVLGKNLGGFFHIDLVHEPVRGLYVAGISRQGLWASTNGSSWQPAAQIGLPTAGLPAVSEMHRISLATRGGHLWAFVIVNPNPKVTDPCIEPECELYRAHELFMLHRNASSWRKVSKPTGLGFKGFLGYVAAPPNSDGLVVAAEHLFRTDNIHALIPAWQRVEFGETASLHGDQHAIAFVDADTWYVGDDGGAFVTLNRGEDWQSLNATLRTTEFYSATANSLDSGSYVGGQQDNGQAVSTDGVSWRQFLWGDGMYTHADPFDANSFFVSTQFGNISYLSNGSPARRVVNFADNNDSAVSDGRGAFLTPFEILPRDPRLYEGVTAPPGFDFSQARILLTGNINPWLVAYIPGDTRLTARLLNRDTAINKQYIQYIAPDPLDATAAYFVTGDKSPGLYKLTNISFEGNATVSQIGVPFEGQFPDVLGHIAASPVCAEALYVAKVGFLEGQKILKTTTKGENWINISGNLPNVPVHWITLDPANPNVIYVGTNIGAFVATDGGVEGEQWRRLGTGLPNVPVMQLKVTRTRRLIAATFGRGVWTLQLPPLLPYLQRPPVIANVEVNPAVLWPPDRSMVDVAVNYTVTDDCGMPACTLSVSSSEPDGGEVDYEIVDANHVRLRAERVASGPGRTYTITISCTGNDGLTTSTTTTVLVPQGG